MALTVFTSDPNTLLKSIRKAIDDKRVETWAYDRDGDFFHTPEQWKGKAWLKPIIQQGALSFGLVGQKGVTMTKLVYGVYHGRFIEMLLVHFDKDFNNVSATALADSVDQFK
ncbi:hypothetical protein ACNRDB_03590 [Ralstonia pseudosolanacearum]|uniref:hypothetical protein n=1 Tax=Ralstonia pseudosolanacearum TaxID=1310165 RepID=UPI0018D0A157|nr:hypothetical protein [Ralstonia pseudosolanacearum]MDO3529463.1 hypothetical protein [Ralstonia pseudosolanacearum]